MNIPSTAPLQPPPGQDELMTVPEAAEKLHISTKHVHKLIAEKKLHATKFSARTTRVYVYSVEAYRNQGSNL